MGIDRLVMFLTNSRSIKVPRARAIFSFVVVRSLIKYNKTKNKIYEKQDVVLFPAMKAPAAN